MKMATSRFGGNPQIHITVEKWVDSSKFEMPSDNNYNFVSFVNTLILICTLKKRS